MATEPDKRKPGRPREGRHAQLNFRIDPDSHAKLSKKLKEYHMGPTAFGVCFVQYFLQSSRATQLAIIGRGLDAGDAPSPALNLMTDHDNGQTVPTSIKFPANPPTPGSKFDPKRKVATKRPKQGGK